MKNILKNVPSLLFTIIFSIIPTFSQVTNIQFIHLTTEHGLSATWVRTIYQDQYGFIWIGTEEGLNRFDGINFKTYYRTVDDSFSLSSSSISCLYEDYKGRLWVGTRQGLNIFNRETERFLRLPQFNTSQITCFLEESKKYFWIGTTINLYKINLENDSIVEQYDPADIVPTNIQPIGNNIYSLLIDSKNNFWIATGYGLHLFDRSKKKFINFLHDEHNPNSIASNDVRKIIEDPYGRLWIGTSAGLDVLIYQNEEAQKAIFYHYKNKPDNPNSLPQQTILDLLINQNNLWIGIENGGIAILPLTKELPENRFILYKSEQHRKYSLSNNSIYCFFKDKQDILWIGTFGNGINLVTPQSMNFLHILSEPGVSNSLSNNQVNTFLDDGNDIWIGTEGGLNRYNKKTKTFSYFTHNPLDPTSIGSNAVWALYKDKEGNLWIGTWSGGLNRFNYRTQTFERFLHNPLNPHSIGSNNVFSILEDSEGTLWIGTMGDGLNVLDRKTKTFKHYNTSNSGIYTNFVQAIVESKVEPALWLVNNTAVARFDKIKKEFKIYTSNPSVKNSLSSNKIVSIYEDSKGNLWCGTALGLNLLNREKDNFIIYTTKDGLPHNSVNSIIEDDLGNIWLGTNKGLVKFINAVNTPLEPRFKHYTLEDGLQSNSFGRRSAYRAPDGLLYFGGTNGFNIIDPSNLVENHYIPPIVITDVFVMNKPFPIGTKGFRFKPNTQDELVFSYKQTVLTFHFAALNYIAPQKNEYSYKLEGFDNDWIFIGNNRSVTYTNLDPGEYILRIKGSNNDGKWNEQGTALRIVIQPPFWKTWWFRSLAGLSMVCIAYLFYRHRLRQRAIAEQLKLDAIIAQERKMLRTLIDNIPEKIYVKDRNGKYIIGNKTLITFLGMENEASLIGKTDQEIFKPQFASLLNQYDNIILKESKSIFETEFSVEEKDGSRWISLTKVPLKDSTNIIIGVVSIIRDITAHKNYELEREKLISDLQQALADVKTLSGLLPICSNCKKIRDDQGYWTQLELYIQQHSSTKFTHGICPECAKKLYPEFYTKEDKNTST